MPERRSSAASLKVYSGDYVSKDDEVIVGLRSLEWSPETRSRILEGVTLVATMTDADALCCITEAYGKELSDTKSFDEDPELIGGLLCTLVSREGDVIETVVPFTRDDRGVIKFCRPIHWSSDRPSDEAEGPLVNALRWAVSGKVIKTQTMPGLELEVSATIGLTLAEAFRDKQLLAQSLRGVLRHHAPLLQGSVWGLEEDV